MVFWVSLICLFVWMKRGDAILYWGFCAHKGGTGPILIMGHASFAPRLCELLRRMDCLTYCLLLQYIQR